MFDINPMDLILSLPWIVFGFVFHEYCHAWMSDRLGDPFPGRDGRLSLSPIRHIDPFGLLALVFLKFGWAKPVQINPSYYRNPMKDTVKVALAGPGGNFILAIIIALFIRIITFFNLRFDINGIDILYNCFSIGLFYMLSLGFFNLIPIPPLDGSKVLRYFLKGSAGYYFDRLEPYGIFIVIILALAGAYSGILIQLIRITSTLLTGQQIF